MLHKCTTTIPTYLIYIDYFLYRSRATQKQVLSNVSLGKMPGLWLRWCFISSCDVNKIYIILACKLRFVRRAFKTNRNGAPRPLRPNYCGNNKTSVVLQPQCDFSQTENLSVSCKICSVRRNRNGCELYIYGALAQRG